MLSHCQLTGERDTVLEVAYFTAFIKCSVLIKRHSIIVYRILYADLYCSLIWVMHNYAWAHTQNMINFAHTHVHLQLSAPRARGLVFFKCLSTYIKYYMYTVPSCDHYIVYTSIHAPGCACSEEKLNKNLLVHNSVSQYMLTIHWDDVQVITIGALVYTAWEMLQHEGAWGCDEK